MSSCAVSKSMVWHTARDKAVSQLFLSVRNSESKWLWICSFNIPVASCIFRFQSVTIPSVLTANIGIAIPCKASILPCVVLDGSSVLLRCKQLLDWVFDIANISQFYKVHTGIFNLLMQFSFSPTSPHPNNVIEYAERKTSTSSSERLFKIALEKHWHITRISSI